MRLLFMSLVVAMPISAQAVPRFVATDLGDLPGGLDSSIGMALNQYGQVAGGSRSESEGSSSGLERAFLWTPTAPNGTVGAMRQIDLLPGPLVENARAMAINDIGQVVGSSGNANITRVFLWTPKTSNGVIGSIVDLGNPVTDYNDHVPGAINSVGQVAGANYADTVMPEPFLFSPAVPNSSGGSFSAIPAPMVRPEAMNSYGQVVGWGGTEFGATLFTPVSPNAASGVISTLPLLPGRTWSMARGMNDAGQVVGDFFTSSGGFEAFVWRPDAPNSATGQVSLLPRLLPVGSSQAFDVNNHGDVVGTAPVPLHPGFDNAVLWSVTEGVIDLNSALTVPLPPNWRLIDAVSINDAGQILANGFYSDPNDDRRSSYHAFLLTPVPEPAAAALVVFAAGSRRRTHRR